MGASVTDMDWPARSCDFNCIANAWAELARRVYHRRRHYETESDLREALFYAWDSLDITYISNLVWSMPRCAKDCYDKRGQVTSY